MVFSAGFAYVSTNKRKVDGLSCPLRSQHLVAAKAPRCINHISHRPCPDPAWVPAFLAPVERLVLMYNSCLHWKPQICLKCTWDLFMKGTKAPQKCKINLRLRATHPSPWRHSRSTWPVIKGLSIAMLTTCNTLGEALKRKDDFRRLPPKVKRLWAKLLSPIACCLLFPSISKTVEISHLRHGAT